jgi:ATP/ADP translocase
MILIINIYVRVLPPHLSGVSSENTAKNKNTGMLEGIRLLFKHKYIAGIFCIATFYEIVGTILDFQMKLLARQAYTTP